MKNRNDLVADLKIVKEHLGILRNMLLSEQRRIVEEINLVTEAKQKIDSALYELTGDEFYKEDSHDKTKYTDAGGTGTSGPGGF